MLLAYGRNPLALINFQPPIANIPASINGPTVFGIPAGAHCNEMDFVKLSAGAAIPCVAGDSTLYLGIIQQDSSAIFAQDSVVTTDVQGVFGFVQAASGGLFPPTIANVLIVPLGAPIIVEMSTQATGGWISGGSQQLTYGTAVGLNKDATTGFYYADSTQTASGVIVGKVWGPNRGVVGDLATRVLVAFNAAALAVAQGH